MISTYVGENKEFERQFLTGELEVELVPQGTFSERIRAGGAGIGGFFTPTGYGTLIAEGKETRTIDGKPYVLEMPLTRRFRLREGVEGRSAGQSGLPADRPQLQPGDGDRRRRSRSPRSSTWSSRARSIPDHVVTPGIFVQHILKGEQYEKRIEKRTVGKAEMSATKYTKARSAREHPRRGICRGFRAGFRGFRAQVTESLN